MKLFTFSLDWDLFLGSHPYSRPPPSSQQMDQYHIRSAQQYHDPSTFIHYPENWRRPNPSYYEPFDQPNYFGNNQNPYEHNNDYHGNHTYYARRSQHAEPLSSSSYYSNPSREINGPQNVYYSSYARERTIGIPREYLPLATEWKPSKNHRYLDVEDDFQRNHERRASNHATQDYYHRERESGFEDNTINDNEHRTYRDYEGDASRKRKSGRVNERNDRHGSIEGRTQQPALRDHRDENEREPNRRDRDRSRNSSRERRHKRERSKESRMRERSKSRERERSTSKERTRERSTEQSNESSHIDTRAGRSEGYTDKSREKHIDFRRSAENIDQHADSNSRYSRYRRGGNFRFNHSDRKYRVPYNWIDIEPIGDIIEGTNLVAMKVPLIKLFTPKVTWTPQEFLEKAREKGFKVGMVIDLTNTSKYYNGHVDFKSEKETEEEVIIYHKFPIEGYMELPSAETIQQFTNLVIDFEKKNPDKQIVIHCTHGLNRTGYLIAHYLINVKGLSVSEALKLFSRSRPPGLIKQAYVMDLYKQYAPDEEVKEPEIPLWAVEKYSWKKAPADVVLNSSVSSNDDVNVDMNLSI